ncbi:hypothetical protein L0Y41_03755 [bacterium]|nr:hypothetical protein [bacterium]
MHRDNFFSRIPPEWLLRLGIAGVYFYTSTDIFRHTAGWYWAIQSLPDFFQHAIGAIGIDTYLRMQAAGEFIIALVMIGWFFPKAASRWAGLLVAFQMGLILLLVGLNLETYRDIGILGAGLALFALLSKK